MAIILTFAFTKQISKISVNQTMKMIKLHSN